MATFMENPDGTRIYSLTASELMQLDLSGPHDYERGYRKGYRDGYDAALEHFLDLQRKGGHSPRAAYNILSDFWQEELQGWAAGFEDESEEPPEPEIRPKVGSLSKRQRQAIYERDRGLCGICGKPVDPEEWQIDHRVPLSRGGDDTPENWQLAHPKCNRRKWAH